MLHVVGVTTPFVKVCLFDGAGASVTVNNVNALDGLRHELGEEVVGVEKQGFEHS
ncbi:hypothetical protein LguiB_000093 [Lonicera macranthoides]